MGRRTGAYGWTWRRFTIVLAALLLMGFAFIEKHQQYQSWGAVLVAVFVLMLIVTIVVRVVSLIRLILGRR